MPSAVRTAKAKERKEAQAAVEKAQQEGDEVDVGDDEGKNEDIHKLVYEYLMSEDMHGTVKSFLKDVGSDVKHFKSLADPEDSLEAVYESFLAAKSAASSAGKAKKAKTEHHLLSMEDGSTDSKEDGIKEDSKEDSSMAESSSEAAAAIKKKRKRATAAEKKDAPPPLEGLEGGMKEETQKQYTFGWKRYVEYCELHSLNTMVGEQVCPANQILEFARYLMQNPVKTVKSSVANSYVSAVGKKLLEANVITAMRDIRTAELKELFAEAGRAHLAAVANTSNESSAATTIATASTSHAASSDSTFIASSDVSSDIIELQTMMDTKKKKRVSS